MIRLDAGRVVKVSDMFGNEPLFMTIRESMVSNTPFSEMPELILKGDLHRPGSTFALGDAITHPKALAYKKVIFHPPATIVLWNDGSKTVVKCDGRDTYDARTGLALCFMKKALGNRSRALNDILHKELVDD